MGKFHDDADEDQFLTEQQAGEKKSQNVNVNMGNIKVVEGGGKKKNKKKKGQVVQPAATQQQ